MIKFHTIGQIEKLNPFVDAVVKKAVLNGDFGEITTGEFAVGTKKKQVVMQLECGDDAGVDKYEIPAGSHVRVLDLEKLEGQLIEVWGHPLPATFSKNDKLESETDGTLKTGASAAPYLEVMEVLGNKEGALVKVVTVATDS